MPDTELVRCPFELVEKEMGHKPYKIKFEGWYYIQCTCGARGPMTPRDMEADAWNTRDQDKVAVLQRIVDDATYYLKQIICVECEHHEIGDGFECNGKYCSKSRFGKLLAEAE